MYGCTYAPCGSMNCIIPPHMVDAIKLRGDAKQRAMAEAVEKLAEVARDERLERPSPLPTAFISAQPLAGAGAASKTSGGPVARIEIHDGQKKATLPGTSVRKSGQPAVADASVNEAFDGSQWTYDLYVNEYGRDSLDGKGPPRDKSRG